MGSIGLPAEICDLSCRVVVDLDLFDPGTGRRIRLAALLPNDPTTLPLASEHLGDEFGRAQFPAHRPGLGRDYPRRGRLADGFRSALAPAAPPPPQRVPGAGLVVFEYPPHRDRADGSRARPGPLASRLVAA